MQLIGEASLCWDEPSVGRFDSSKGIKIGEEALSQLKQAILKCVPEEKELGVKTPMQSQGLRKKAEGWNACRQQFLTKLEEIWKK